MIIVTGAEFVLNVSQHHCRQTTTLAAECGHGLLV
jgi:hypothetical protein